VRARPPVLCLPGGDGPQATASTQKVATGDRHAAAYLRMGGELAAEGPGSLGTGSRLFGGRRRNGGDSWGGGRGMKVERRAG
jgi:hypothetical protein